MKEILWNDLLRDSDDFHLGFVHYGKEEKYPLHRHDFAEISLVESGYGWQSLNGKKEEISRGSLFIITSDDSHSLQAGSKGMSFFNMAFPAARAMELSERYFEKNVLETASYKLGADPFSFLLTLLHDALSLQRTFMLLDFLLLGILRKLDQPFVGILPAGAPPWLASACSRIGEPEELVLGVDRFFQMAGRSKEHTSRTMKKYTGISPVDYVNGLKLERAARLLCSSDDTVLGIALSCGFENLSWFHRLFQNRYGTTPHQYRIGNLYPVGS